MQSNLPCRATSRWSDVPRDSIANDIAPGPDFLALPEKASLRRPSDRAAAAARDRPRAFACHHSGRLCAERTPETLVFELTVRGGLRLRFCHATLILRVRS